MSARRRAPAAVCAALAALACGSGTGTAEEAGYEVRGTVLEAATGQPLAGATVRAPGGATATSDERGRFALRAEGAGRLEAEAPGGLRAANPLEPPRREQHGEPGGGRLEVVLHLR
jgi:hypothetical protein